MKCLAVIILSVISLMAQAPEKKAALGKRMAAEFSRIDNPILQNYLDRLAQRLANRPLIVSAISDDRCRTTRECVVLPGGYIFVPAQLFLAAKNEAEFAGMMAHAIAHLPQRSMGGWVVSCSEDLVPRAVLEARKKEEAEAGIQAAQIVARAGFDVSANSSEDFTAAQQEAQRLMQTPRRTPPSLARKAPR